MPRLGTHRIHQVCVALAIALVLAGWMWNLRSLFAQTQVEREGGIWESILTSHVPRVAQEVRQGTSGVKATLTPVLQQTQELSHRRQAYEAAIQEMKETWPYVQTGTQKTDAR